MKSLITLKVLILAFMLVGISACSVQNNLYLNDPRPLEKGGTEVHFGLSTGIQPKLDSLSTNDDVYYSEGFKLAPSLHLGGKFRLNKKLALGAQFHFPYIVGGIGLDLRPQFSFFDRNSKFQAAITGQFGFVASKDSSKRIDAALPQFVNSMLNADVALPLGFQLNKDVILTITPRISHLSFAVRENLFSTEESQNYKYNAFIVTLGVKYKYFFFESSLHYFAEGLMPTFGIAIGGANKSKKGQ